MTPDPSLPAFDGSLWLLQYPCQQLKRTTIDSELQCVCIANVATEAAQLSYFSSIACC